MDVALFWDERLLAYRFHPEHPFNPRRWEVTVDLLRAANLVRPEEIHSSVVADDEVLTLVHTRGYVEAVRALSDEAVSPWEGGRWGLGTEDNPIFPGMHEAAARIVGTTCRAAAWVMEQPHRRAFAIAGGLHHAHRDRASGFCIYNDVAVAIAWLRRAYDARVLYLDIDAHHGDGVQAIFYDSPHVLTVSTHETGRFLFPGSGFVDELGEGQGYGFSWNLPVEPFSDDDAWAPPVLELLEGAFDFFRPDVVVLQAGCDGHAFDPLTHLYASTSFYEAVVQRVVALADAICDGRLLVTGGGGYAIWQVVPRVWGLVWGILAERAVPDAVPEVWRTRWQTEAPLRLPERWRDNPAELPRLPPAARTEIAARNRRALETLRRVLAPLRERGPTSIR